MKRSPGDGEPWTEEETEMLLKLAPMEKGEPSKFFYSASDDIGERFVQLHSASWQLEVRRVLLMRSVKKNSVGKEEDEI